WSLTPGQGYGEERRILIGRGGGRHRGDVYGDPRVAGDTPLASRLLDGGESIQPRFAGQGKNWSKRNRATAAQDARIHDPVNRVRFSGGSEKGFGVSRFSEASLNRTSSPGSCIRRGYRSRPRQREAVRATVAGCPTRGRPGVGLNGRQPGWRRPT